MVETLDLGPHTLAEAKVVIAKRKWKGIALHLTMWAPKVVEGYVPAGSEHGFNLSGYVNLTRKEAVRFLESTVYSGREEKGARIKLTSYGTTLWIG